MAMFPFFPFGPVPPVPFLFPFAAMAGLFPRPAPDDGEAGERSTPFGGMAPSMMGLAMMPAMAPFALSGRLAQVVEDAGQVAAQVRDSLARDEGPVHVMVGDPDGPLGLAIGLTFMTRGQTPALPGAGEAEAAPRLGPMVDVTPAGAG
ncbi:hypothetical protein [Roseospira navarrensis]|uniref:Uncharacterized protein n=1 Tax=Roseospira navarrensis TaxID=140058 RepID=A0A7X1ZEF3_9PROT|nr:hypothetical protein [Roseospira navarrensis]MQX37040.1 hypothetical protein [Roseospira navarrensis]